MRRGLLLLQAALVALLLAPQSGIAQSATPTSTSPPANVTFLSLGTAPTEVTMAASSVVFGFNGASTDVPHCHEIDSFSCFLTVTHYQAVVTVEACTNASWTLAVASLYVDLATTNAVTVSLFFFFVLVLTINRA